MTDKEIIIDGVNVAGCCCFENGKCLWQKKYYESGITPDCAEIENCYYKQLQRKEQELKHLRATLKNKNIVAIIEEHDKLKQECEELKEASLTLAEGLNYRQNTLDHYKQALEKIEEYTKTTLTMPLERKVILTIINEVKE